METDFRAFFMLVETIIETGWDIIFKKYSCQGKHSCQKKLIFWLVETSDFFRLVEKYFQQNLSEYIWLVETVFFCLDYFLLLETVTEISGRQFLKKDYTLTNGD